MGRKPVRVGLHVLLWLAIYIIPFLITYGSLNLPLLLNEPGSWLHIRSTLLLIAYAYLNYYLLIPVLYLQRKYIVYAMVVIAAVLVVIWLPQFFTGSPGGHPNNHPPFDGPPHGEPPHGPPPSQAFSKMSYNIILFVICTFISISVRQQQQLLEIQKEKLNAELSFLKAQINPHFLFNTLNSIYALSIQKSNDTPTAIIQLSEFMRYMLKDTDADTVPLEKELTYISNYIALQKRRLGNTVQIKYTAPTGIINYKIAPLILMSFVENAFKHGVNPDQDSAIELTISLQGKQLHLLIENNKVTSIANNEAMGIGSKNAVSRLAHFYPKKHLLTINDNEKIYSVNLTLELND